MSTFPSFKPAQRSVSMGEMPIKTYRALNGITVRRSFGNQRFAYRVELSFDGLIESKLAAIWDHYHDDINIREGFPLPDSIFSGYSGNNDANNNTGFISRVNRFPQIRWFYAEPPQIESVALSYSNVKVVFIGELLYTT